MGFLITLALVNFTHVLDFMVIMPLASEFQLVFDVDPKTWGIIIGSYTLAAALSSFLSIFFLDRFERKRALLVMYAGFIIGTFLVCLSKNLEQLILTRTITGLFGGVLMSIILAMVGDLFPASKRGKAVGIVVTGFSAAAALGVPIGLALSMKWDWRAPFLAIALVSLVVALLVWLFSPQSRKHLLNSPKPFSGLVHFSQDKNQWLAMGFLFLVILGQFTVIPFIAPYMEFNVGFSKQQLTLMYFLGGLATVFSSPLIGKLADRFPRVKLATLLFLLSFIPILLLTQMDVAALWYAYLVTTLLFIFLSGRLIPPNAIIIGTAHPESRGSFMSIRASVNNLAAALAAWLAGIIVIQNADNSYSNFEMVGYFAVAAGLLSLLLLNRIKERY